MTSRGWSVRSAAHSGLTSPRRRKSSFTSPVSEVFDAIVNPETMSRFWFTRRDDGLRAGETVTWYIGAQPNAPQLEVRVTSLVHPCLIVMEWENAGGLTTVTWTFEGKSQDTTLLRVEETGYSGTRRRSSLPHSIRLAGSTR